MEFDDRVFEFSNERNLIHLLPDGFQADLVREVFEADPNLAEDFAGFTLFNDHVGLFHATAPTVPTIFNGKPFDPSRGHKYGQVINDIATHAYQNYLDEAGYRMDFISIVAPYCSKKAATCVVRPFNDLKPRGYFQYENDSPKYSLRLIADLTLFRHLPMYLKENVYNDGNWFLSDTSLDETSPFPDPVIREWTDNIKVVDGLPRYKWYHYIGTHEPPQWDTECSFNRNLERTRESYKQQTYCVLTGIAQFLNKLKDEDIYDRTAVVISGDHGLYTPSYDLNGDIRNDIIYSRRFLSIARPAFMVKELDNNKPLKYNDHPTSMIDVALTALDLVDLSGNFEGVSAFSLGPDIKRERQFLLINKKLFWSGDAIPYDEYRIDGPSANMASWKLTDIQNGAVAPTGYPDMSAASAARFTRGLAWSRKDPGNTSPRIRGTEFAFLISKPDKVFDALKLRVQIPKSIKKQSVSLNVNGQAIVEAHPVSMADSLWTNIKLPVDQSAFRLKNNFVSVVFDKMKLRADGENKDSGWLASIEFL